MTGDIPPDERALFQPALGRGQAAILVDGAGLVLAGTVPSAGGHDAAAEMGAELAGVSDEARRTTRHLAIGRWQTIVFETEGATVALSPVDSSTDDRTLLVALGDTDVPLGALRRSVRHCVALALASCEGQGR